MLHWHLPASPELDTEQQCSTDSAMYSVINQLLSQLNHHYAFGLKLALRLMLVSPLTALLEVPSNQGGNRNKSTSCTNTSNYV